MKSKSTAQPRRYLLLCCLLALSGTIAAQSISHVNGSYCVGSQNVFVFSGSSTSVVWGINGSYTTISQTGNTLVVKWNSPISNTSLSAHSYSNNTSATLSPITIGSSVNPSVSITSTASTICAGTSVTFTAAATNAGTSPIYQWYSNGNIISGATASTYSSAALTDAQQISCLVYTSAACYTTYSATSNIITMHVTTRLAMTLSISGSSTVCTSGTTSFVAYPGNYTGNLTYQWKRNGNNVSSTVQGPPPYVLATNVFANNDVFTCVVTSDGCAAPAISNAITITTTSPQTFTAGVSPTSINACTGSPINFNATTNLTATSYQWSVNGSAVAGATLSTFSVNASSITQLKSVSVYATTAAACVNNTTATGTGSGIPFTIADPVTPGVSISPTNSTLVLGTAGNFTATPVNGGSYPGYQWLINGSPVAGATSATFSPTINAGSEWQTISVSLTSNATCAINPATASTNISLVSQYWEDLNYVREHVIQVSGVTDWIGVNNLPIGQKRQVTTYVDGLGRPIEKVARETATPASGTLWGDVVQIVQYDAYGRQPQQYLPYTTTTESRKYKTTATTEQPQYFQTTYGETAAFNQMIFDNSPLSKILNYKTPGSSWNASPGSTATYDLNSSADSVQIFAVGYNTGDAPVGLGIYPANALYRVLTVNEMGKSVIHYLDQAGRLILRKVQIADVPGTGHDGWLCTYQVYDDYSSLRYELTPLAVNYLMANGWTFTGTNGNTVLNEYCNRSEYDDKGRLVVKKAAGVSALYEVYDTRDRLAFVQDGNQRAKSTTEWTATLFDELDRPILTTLYETNKLASDLKNDLSTAGLVTTSVSLATPSASIAPFQNAIAGTDLNNASVTTNVKVLFYDRYTYSGVKSFSTSFDNLQAYTTGDPIASTPNTLNLPTGGYTRILGTSTFLIMSTYYDEKGRPIQSLADNIKTGIDVTTRQFDFDDRELSTNLKHSATNTAYTNYSIVNKNLFDILGRVSSIQQQFGTNPFKTIVSYDFDDLGRVKTKHLDPGYTGSGKTEMEALTYSYNLKDQLTGINADYALKTPGKYSKWGNFFGVYLGYDNKDASFAAAQLDGHLAGSLWTTQGDDAQRKYDYTYDNAGQLTQALFHEKATTADSWSNTKMDFSVSGTRGKIEYDLNGNMTTLLQKGVIAGNPTPVNMDDLTYTYTAFTNRLKTVADASPNGALNGKMGDFVDGGNGTADDYVFDANGNEVSDLNKNVTDLNNVVGANGVQYNYLDKPVQVRIKGKGTLTNVFDADGNKLQQTFTPEVTGSPVTTSYIGPFVYTGDNLSYLLFEEGRIRVMQAATQNNGYDLLTLDGNMDLPNSMRGAYDFFIRDQQSNVRMILTEETHSGSNSCSMETARATNEEPMFGKVDVNGVPTADNEVKARFAVSSIPGQASNNGWTNSTIGSYVSRIGNLATSKIGPNTLLKVMAGDQISATTIYYYQNPVTNQSGGVSLVTDLLTSLAQAISGGSATTGLVHGSTTATNITSQLGGSAPFSALADPDAANASGTNPKAYLTVLFFDERFNVVTDGSASVRVTQSGNGAPALVLTNIKAPKNGYAYVYLSNESDEMLYFDNLQVSNVRGRIIEENHYYAYGLKAASLSSKKLGDPNDGSLKNTYQYQGDYSEASEETGWNGFALRSYDPQIGRFINNDPVSQFASGYTGMGNEPASMIDPTGGISIDFGDLGSVTGSILGDRLLVAGAGAAIGYGVDKISGGNGARGAIIGGVVGFGITFIPPFDINVLFKGPVKAAVVDVAEVSENVLTRSQVVGDIARTAHTADPSLAMSHPLNAPSLVLNVPPPPPPPAPNAPAATPRAATPPPAVRNPPPAGMPWMDVAATQLGVREHGADNHGPEVRMYLRTVGLGEGFPWCAAFVNWTLRSSGLRGTGSGAASSYSNWGVRLPGPAVGSIGVIRHADGTGHVGFVAGRTPNGSIVLLGGNQGNMVKYAPFRRSTFVSFSLPAGVVPNYNLPVMRNIQEANNVPTR